MKISPSGEVPAAAEKKAEPLVPVSGAFAAKPVADAEKVKREIVFAEGSSELDELSKKKIDAIIASLTMPAPTKSPSWPIIMTTVRMFSAKKDRA